MRSGFKGWGILIVWNTATIIMTAVVWPSGRAFLLVPKRMRMMRAGLRRSNSSPRPAPVFATHLGRRPFVNHDHQNVHENIGQPLRFSSFATTTSNTEDSVPQTLRTALTRQILPHIVPDATTTLVFLVGVSGGCDSVALLHSLLQIVQPLDDDNDDVPRWRLGSDNESCLCHIDVAHFDHEQRGIESTSDCQFVQELCQQYRLPLHLWRWSEDHNNGNKPFSQDMARTWRRHHMERRLRELVACHESAVGVILTAHHRDDSMESLLLKLLRGAHITNFRGMKAVVQHEDNVWYARPLLNVSKRHLITYLQQHNYVWREDSSNQSNKYLRNRVRNELIPLLSNLVAQGSGSTVSDNNHLLYKRLQNLEQQSQEVQRDLKARSQRYLDDDDQQYFALDPSLSFSSHLDYKFALYEWMRQRTVVPYEALERVCVQVDEKPDNRQWRLSLEGGVDLVREGNVLSMVESGDNNKDNPMQPIRWQRLTGGEEEDTATIEEESAPEKNNNKETYLYIECPPRMLPNSSKLSFFATTCGHVHDMGLRFAAPWWSDDRQPIPIKEFLRGQKVPLHQRALAPVIVLGEGTTKDTSASTMQVVAAPATQVVAVFVPSKDKWICAKLFSSTAANEQTNGIGRDGPKQIWLRLFVSSSP